ECDRPRHLCSGGARAVIANAVEDGGSRIKDLVALLAPHARDLLQDLDKPWTPPLRARRKVGAAIERLEIRRQPDTHGPPAGAGGRLHERHVDAIDVGTLLAIDLDRDEALVDHG